MQRLQAWAGALTLTLAGIAIVIVAAILAMRYLSPLIGGGIYVVLFGVAAVLGLLIGRVVRWLAD